MTKFKRKEKRKEKKEYIKELEKDGFTCIPNPNGDGYLCYKDYVSFANAMMNCRKCPNCLVPLKREHFWKREMKCPKCGFTLAGV